MLVLFLAQDAAVGNGVPQGADADLEGATVREQAAGIEADHVVRGIHGRGGWAQEGVEEYRQFIAVYKGVFLDMRFLIEDQFAGGDRGATRWVATVSGESEDALLDEDTGEPLAIDGVTITQHDPGGKIVAEWAVWDTHSLLRTAAAPRIFEQLSINV